MHPLGGIEYKMTDEAREVENQELEKNDGVEGSIIGFPTMSSPHPLALVGRLAESGRPTKSIQLTSITDQTIM